jgi:ribonuclease P protein component
LLPKAARIREEREFRTAFTKGRSYKGDLIVVYVLPRRGESMRFGFTTVKKIGGAVERNRLKRLLREAAKKLMPRLRSGTDIIVLARAQAAGASLHELAAELEKLLERAGVLEQREQEQ